MAKKSDSNKLRPKRINILGIVYRVTYMDKPSDVDVHRRVSLWGQIDYWDRSIRIFDDGRSDEDIWQTILHEVLHGIGAALHLDILKEGDNEKSVDILATALQDVMFRNGWMDIYEKAKR